VWLGPSTTWRCCTSPRASMQRPNHFSNARLRFVEKARGPEHPDVGESLNNLAALYYTQGQYAEAEPLYQRALAIRAKPRNPRIFSDGTRGLFPCVADLKYAPKPFPFNSRRKKNPTSVHDSAGRCG